MNEATEMTEAQSIANAIAELRARQDKLLAAARQPAIAQVLAIIAAHKLTKSDINPPSWPKRKPRNDAGKPRGKRKAAAPTAPQLVAA